MKRCRTSRSGGRARSEEGHSTSIMPGIPIGLCIRTDSMTGHAAIFSFALNIFPIILVVCGRSIEEVMAEGCSDDDCRDAVDESVPEEET